MINKIKMIISNFNVLLIRELKMVLINKNLVKVIVKKLDKYDSNKIHIKQFYLI